VKTFKARGVVIREAEAGESDKRLTLLCKSVGRLTVYARGARKPKSKFAAAAQLFVYSDFIICDGRAFYAVAQAEPIESFYALRSDYERLGAAHFAAEICEKTIMDDTPADDLLLLFLKTLAHLCRSPENTNRISPRHAAFVFLFRFYKCYGISPETEGCCVCGEEFDGGDAVYFCDEGAVCKGCSIKKPRRTALSGASLAALKHILNSGLKDAFLFTIRGGAYEELSRAGKLFWESHFQIKLNSEWPGVNPDA